jgi:hypothetical protein
MLLGFKPRFREPILNLTKVFTMRGERKVEPKIGETLYMYTGLRTPHCKLITNKEKLFSKQDVEIGIISEDNIITIGIVVDERQLTEDEIEEFVKWDGFHNTDDFAKYWLEASKEELKKQGWKKGLDFLIQKSVTLYHWTDLRY